MGRRNKEGKTPREAKEEDVLREGMEDYDSEDEENNAVKELVEYLRSLEGGGGGGMEAEPA